MHGGPPSTHSSRSPGATASTAPSFSTDINLSPLTTAFANKLSHSACLPNLLYACPSVEQINFVTAPPNPPSCQESQGMKSQRSRNRISVEHLHRGREVRLTAIYATLTATLWTRCPGCVSERRFWDLVTAELNSSNSFPGIWRFTPCC